MKLVFCPDCGCKLIPDGRRPLCPSCGWNGCEFEQLSTEEIIHQQIIEETQNDNRD